MNNLRCNETGKFLKTKSEIEKKINKLEYRSKNREKNIKYQKEYRSLRKNKDKHNEWRRNKKKENPFLWNFKRFKASIKTKFNLSVVDFVNFVKLQKGKCAICGKFFYERNKAMERYNKPNIDHCHKTNKVRGLLCHHCNTGLGQFKDNTIFLKSAINYLEKNND
jgi:hypothetical protein